MQKNLLYWKRTVSHYRALTKSLTQPARIEDWILLLFRVPLVTIHMLKTVCIIHLLVPSSAKKAKNVPESSKRMEIHWTLNIWSIFDIEIPVWSLRFFLEKKQTQSAFSVVVAWNSYLKASEVLNCLRICWSFSAFCACDLISVNRQKYASETIDPDHSSFFQLQGELVYFFWFLARKLVKVELVTTQNTPV